jgi:hypothetical protein
MSDVEFRPIHQVLEVCTMTRGTWGRILGLCVVVVGTGLVYRAFIDRWEGDVRAPLIAAGMAGIAYFVLILLIGSWIERRENLKRREPRN